MTTTINAKALHEIAIQANKNKEETRFARLEDFIVTKILPECQKKAEEGQFAHRDELIGLTYSEITYIITILISRYGFNVRRLESGKVLIKWNEEN